MTNSKYNRKTSNTKEKKKVCYLKIEIWKDINGYEDSIKSAISAVCRDERNTAGGYKWKYAS